MWSFPRSISTKIQVGQAVQLSFDAIPNKTYNGKVTTVGTVGASSQGVVNFPVTVQLDRCRCAK